MRQTRVMLAGVVATIALAACGRSGSAPIDLGRELDAATGDSMGLLPNRGGTQVVSAIERTAGSAATAANRATRSPRAVKAPVQTTRVAREAEAIVVGPEAPAPRADPAATPAPTPTPTPHRRGGYSTMGDIMRNAPFPINPADARRLTD